MDILALLTPIVVPVFVAAGLGYGWARSGVAFDRGFVTKLVGWIGTPCLAFESLTGGGAPLGDLLAAMGFAVLAIVATGVLAWPILQVAGGGARDLGGRPRQFLPSVMLCNAGNLGLPLCLFAYGEAGLALGFGFSVVMVLGHFTIGAVLVADKPKLFEVVKAPVLWAIVVAALFVVSGTEPPLWLANTTGLLAGLTIPLMLLMLGVSLASLKVTTLGTSLLIALLRLGLGLAVGLAIVALFRLDGLMAGIVVLQSTMPVAVYNYLMAMQYRGPETAVAGSVVLSTAIALAGLPFLLAWLLEFSWWLG